MKLPVQNRSIISISIVLALGFSAIYLFPFLVPVRDGLSDSYLFGFSNRAAILLLAVFTLSFALWTRGLAIRLPDPKGHCRHSFPRITVVAIAAVIVAGTFMWVLAKILVPAGEAQYFLDRYAMYGLDWRIYREFEFDYGPLMFYPTLCMARLCHLSVGNAFYLVWVIQWGLGTWLLSVVVSVSARGTKHGRTIFLLLLAFFICGLPDSGPNYTPLRFCGTLSFALGVHHLYTRGASHWATFGLACFGATAALLYSPEQGIAFTIGTVLFFVLCARPARVNVLAGLACFVVVMFFVFRTALHIGVLGNIGIAGGGTLNFPLLFSFQSLVLLLLLVVASCVFIASFRTHTSHGALSYLICLSLVSAPAAFSRADIGHIIINSLGALIAALVVLSQYPAIWRWTWPSFALVVLLFGYSHIRIFAQTTRDQVRSAVFRTQYYSADLDKLYTVVYRATHKNPQQRLDELHAAAELDARRSAPRLSSKVQLLAPFGTRRRIAQSDDRTQVVTGRYPWLFAVGSIPAVYDKIDELRTHSDSPLLIPFRDKASCVEDPNEIRRGLKKLLMVPYVPKPRTTIYAAKPLCDYINANYAASDYASPVLGYFIWFPKEHAPAHSALSGH